MSLYENGKVTRYIKFRKRLDYCRSCVFVDQHNIFVLCTSENSFVILNSQLSILNEVCYSSEARSISHLFYDSEHERIVSGGCDGIHCWKVERDRGLVKKNFNIIKIEVNENPNNILPKDHSWVSWMDLDIKHGFWKIFV